MGLTVDNKSGGMPEIPPGSYPARCIKLIDLGTQQGEYQGKTTFRPQVLVMFELPTELIEDGELEGQPRAISKFYTKSLGEKANLRADLESWRGRAFTEAELDGFDLINILGAPCLVTIIHSEKRKAKIKGVSPLPKGMICPPQVNPSIMFDLDAWISGDSAMQKIFSGFSDKMKAMVMSAEECQSKAPHTEAPPHPAEDDSDIPF